MEEDIRDVITCFRFGDDRFRGLASAEGQILPFPIDFHGRPYNTFTLPCERLINKSVKLGFLAAVHSLSYACIEFNKKAQLSLTNPRDAKACQKLLQFDVLTTLLLTILAYLHSFSCCCVRNLRYPAKYTEKSNIWSSRSSKVIDLGVNRKPMYDFLLVTNSNFGRICYCFRDIGA